MASDEILSSNLSYTITSREQAFVDSVVDPRRGTNMSDIQGVMEEDLTKAFAAVRAELDHEVVKMRDLIRTQVSSLRGEMLTRVDDKMAMFLHTLPSFTRAESPLIHDVVFSGDPQHLDPILYSIYDALAAYLSFFLDEGCRIEWILQHLKPVGLPSADWWLSLFAENLSLFDGRILEGKTAAYPF